ncbi:MAG: radical SAM protein [Acidobacteriota bacterium]
MNTEQPCNILLSHGYCLEEDPHEREVMMPYPPLGLLYLASHLEARGFTVTVHDLTFSSLMEFHRNLNEMRPTVLGLYGNLLTRQRLLEMIALGRSAGATIVLGGPEPAAHAEEYLKRGVDVIVSGEGEETLEALLRHLPEHGLEGLNEIQGVIFKDPSGTIIRTPPRPQIRNLDDQPLPARHTIGLERYLETWRTHHGHSSISLITSRGCPYTCTWCSHAVFARSHRRRSPEAVADEVAHIVKTFNPDRLWYADDVFTLNRPWVVRYAAELRSRNLHIPFECISRADRLNSDVIDALAAMGCRRLWIGSESGSQRILDAMKRLNDVADIQAKCAMLKRNGIEVGIFIMLGFEGETDEDLRATVEHLKTCDPDIFLTTVAYPIAGTEYHAQVAGRMHATQPWEARTDRDLVVEGRHTAAYYRWATRWMVNEVKRHQLRKHSTGSIFQRFRHRLAAWRGRVGMRLTRTQRDPAPGRGWAENEAGARGNSA